MSIQTRVPRLLATVGAMATVLFVAQPPALAVPINVTIDGSDAIFLAGRTDLTIPDADQPWPGGLRRHSWSTPEEIKETLPPTIAVTGGDVVRVADPAVGGISFYNGYGGTMYGPGGNGVQGSNLTAFGGISGYIGPQGPLVGVFLDDAIPNGAAPTTLNFSPSGLGIDFLSLAPGLGQVFYIGDGITSGGTFQEFTAPSGATRLALGIPDGFGFWGTPGAYDDNDGAYQVRIGVNESPDPVPEPATLLLLGSGLAGLAGYGRKRKKDG